MFGNRSMGQAETPIPLLLKRWTVQLCDIGKFWIVVERTVVGDCHGDLGE